MINISDEDFQKIVENHQIILGFLQNCKYTLGPVATPAIGLAEEIDILLAVYNH